MSQLGCNCGKNRATASGTATISGTYRVMVNGKKVYESANGDAANTVAERFSGATVLAPGEQ